MISTQLVSFSASNSPPPGAIVVVAITAFTYLVVALATAWMIYAGAYRRTPVVFVASSFLGLLWPGLLLVWAWMALGKTK